MENKEKTPKIELNAPKNEKTDKIQELLRKAKELNISQKEIALCYVTPTHEDTARTVFSRIKNGDGRLEINLLKIAIRSAISNKILKLELLKEQIKNF